MPYNRLKFTQVINLVEEDDNQPEAADLPLQGLLLGCQWECLHRVSLGISCDAGPYYRAHGKSALRLQHVPLQARQWACSTWQASLLHMCCAQSPVSHCWLTLAQPRCCASRKCFRLDPCSQVARGKGPPKQAPREQQQVRGSILWHPPVCVVDACCSVHAAMRQIGVHVTGASVLLQVRQQIQRRRMKHTCWSWK